MLNGKTSRGQYLLMAESRPCSEVLNSEGSLWQKCMTYALYCICIAWLVFIFSNEFPLKGKEY